MLNVKVILFSVALGDIWNLKETMILGAPRSYDISEKRNARNVDYADTSAGERIEISEVFGNSNNAIGLHQFCPNLRLGYFIDMSWDRETGYARIFSSRVREYKLAISSKSCPHATWFRIRIRILTTTFGGEGDCSYQTISISWKFMRSRIDVDIRRQIRGRRAKGTKILAVGKELDRSNRGANKIIWLNFNGGLAWCPTMRPRRAEAALSLDGALADTSMFECVSVQLSDDDNDGDDDDLKWWIYSV